MFKRKRSDEDFAAEIRAHLELEAEALKGEGVCDDEARRRARVEFGSVQQAKETFRMRGRALGGESFWRDVRYALRGLGRSPGFAVVTVLTLALAIGANTAVFSLLDQAVLRALPVSDPGRLVVFSFAGSHPGHWHSEGEARPGMYTNFRIPCIRICVRGILHCAD